MNWKSLQDLVHQGRGQGHFDEYKPWRFLRRRNPSKLGNQVSGSLPGYARQTSFWSRLEWYFALLLLWLGALDVREKLPMWPMRHPHPLADFPREPKPGALPEARGLNEIASDNGIAVMGITGQCKAPPIKTVDLSVTRAIEGQLAFCLIAIEPEPDEDEGAAEGATRDLELQELYAHETHASFAIVGARVLGEYFGSNLEGFAGAAVLPPALANETRLREFAASVSEDSLGNSLQDAIAAAAKRFRLRTAEASLLYRAAVWRRLIDVDLSEYPVMSEPRKPGASLVAALERELFSKGA